jgi:hypothetical protein
MQAGPIEVFLITDEFNRPTTGLFYREEKNAAFALVELKKKFPKIYMDDKVTPFTLTPKGNTQ